METIALGRRGDATVEFFCPRAASRGGKPQMTDRAKASIGAMSTGGKQSAIQAVIFDLDGVLVDSEPWHHRAANTILEGCHRGSLSVEEYASYLGLTPEQMWRDLIERNKLAGRPTDYVSRYNTMVSAGYRTVTRAPDVVELLDELQSFDLKLAVASSSPTDWVIPCLNALGIRRYFEVIIRGDMVPRGKPDPALFLLAARLLGVPTARCCVVDDAPSGIAAGIAAGMLTVALETPYTNPSLMANANLQIPSLKKADFLPVLLALRSRF